MFGFSMGEMLLLMAIALIAIGPKQLPEVARTLGKLINELKRATGDFTKSFTDVRDDTKNTFSDARKSMNDVFTAGAASYMSQTVRAAPVGTVSTSEPNLELVADAAALFPITADDPFGVGHNSEAHAYDADGHPVVPAAPIEEQLSFQLTPLKVANKDSGDKT